MRTVTYGVACSLDGFITAADGAIDWLHFSSDVQQIMKDYWAGVDTVLMGRKTWQVAAGQGAAGGDAAADTEPAPDAKKKKSSGKRKRSGPATYIFSRTLKTAPRGAELVSSDAGAFVRDLKQQPGKGICVMGGGELARSLFEAGVIDEVGLNIHPVLLGSGVPLFRDAGRIALELIDSRTIDGGCVYATYRVTSRA